MLNMLKNSIISLLLREIPLFCYQAVSLPRIPVNSSVYSALRSRIFKNSFNASLAVSMRLPSIEPLLSTMKMKAKFASFTRSCI